MAKSLPISGMTKTQLEHFFTFYDIERPQGVKDTRVEFQRYLTQMNYKGKRNFIHLMKPETKELIVNQGRGNESVVRPFDDL
jgi:hypothetical protein